MDLFTHVLIAYLISFGVWGPNSLQYVAAGALAGGLPDADALLFPLARRFPLLRHHGITHSIFGVTVIAAAGAFLVPLLLSAVVGSAFAAGSPLYYFLAMEGGGLCHVFLDGFTHFAVPPFAPFSKFELHLDADRAINLGTFAFTGFSFWLMLSERGRVPIPVWEATAWVLLAGYLAYLAVRGVGRWQAGRVCAREGFTAVAPTGNPFVFLLVEERKEGNRVRLRHEEYHLLSGLRSTGRTLEFARSDLPPGPVTTESEALQRSYVPALKRGRMLDMTYHSAEVRSTPGCWEVLWYSLEFTMLGRAAAVLASVDPVSGRVETRNAWMSPRRFESGGR
jgi:membrane-bound metal-dependent hydrolase YbcI (DUF457 family)